MDAPASRLYAAPELAAELGLTARALRFYEAKGLLSPRRVGARRVYDYRDRARLKIIQRAKRLGFSLAEIRDYLGLYDADTSQVEQLQTLCQAVNRRIADLEQQRSALEVTLDELARIRDEAVAALANRAAASGPARESISHPESTNPGDESR